MIAEGSIKLNHNSAIKPSCLRERKLGKCEKLTQNNADYVKISP